MHFANNSKQVTKQNVHTWPYRRTLSIALSSHIIFFYFICCRLVLVLYKIMLIRILITSTIIMFIRILIITQKLSVYESVSIDPADFEVCILDTIRHTTYVPVYKGRKSNYIIMFYLWNVLYVITISDFFHQHRLSHKISWVYWYWLVSL